MRARRTVQPASAKIGTSMVFIDAKCGLLLKGRAHKDSIKEHVLKMPVGKRKKV